MILTTEVTFSMEPSVYVKKLMNLVILTKVVTFPHGAIEESEEVFIKVAPWC